MAPSSNVQKTIVVLTAGTANPLLNREHAWREKQVVMPKRGLEPPRGRPH